MHLLVTAFSHNDCWPLPAPTYPTDQLNRPQQGVWGSITNKQIFPPTSRHCCPGRSRMFMFCRSTLSTAARPPTEPSSQAKALRGMLTRNQSPETFVAKPDSAVSITSATIRNLVSLQQQQTAQPSRALVTACHNNTQQHWSGWAAARAQVLRQWFLSACPFVCLSETHVHQEDLEHRQLPSWRGGRKGVRAPCVGADVKPERPCLGKWLAARPAALLAQELHSAVLGQAGTEVPMLPPMPSPCTSRAVFLAA